MVREVNKLLFRTIIQLHSNQNFYENINWHNAGNPRDLLGKLFCSSSYRFTCFTSFLMIYGFMSSGLLHAFRKWLTLQLPWALHMMTWLAILLRFLSTSFSTSTFCRYYAFDKFIFEILRNNFTRKIFVDTSRKILTCKRMMYARIICLQVKIMMDKQYKCL